jgi:transcriptional regulator with XRE-family HTH domain
VLSTSLAEGLAEYSIGEKLRALRAQKGMGLAELGAHTGLSPALLSKLERGKMFPTLPTLLRIATVFSVGLDHFFRQEPDRRKFGIVRHATLQSFPDDPTGAAVSYRFESLDFTAVERRLNAYRAEFEAIEPERARAHAHAGAEFVHVLEGKLGLHIEGEEIGLETGDSVYFESTSMHSYRRLGSERCAAIVVTTA